MSAYSTLPAPPSGERLSDPDAAISAVFKICTHCLAELSKTEWSALPFVGLQDLDDEWSAELRNHDCGSTIAVIVARELP